MAYDVGDKIELRGVFKDQSGTRVDPATVTFRVKDPDGDVASYLFGTDDEVTKAAVGDYRCGVDTGAPGVSYFRAEGRGSNQAAAEGEFNVSPSHFS